MRFGGLKDFKQGVVKDYGIGRDDRNQAFYRERELDEADIDAPRYQYTFATNPLLYRTRELLGIANENAVKGREIQGHELLPTVAGRAGQMVGSLGADLTQDISRSVWWLLNAAQAAGNVAAEYGLHKANKDLYGAAPIVNKYGKEIPFHDKVGLVEADYGRYKVDPKDNKTRIPVIDPRVYRRGYDGMAAIRNYRSGMVASLSIPSGVAINNALGLLTPFGGSEGYEAVLPDPEDPSKTNNVVGEVATKYILGRTGNLLPYEEFKKVRPDVSRGEYNAYKAFKWDKKGDFDLTDGDFTVPSGVLKGTVDGIHGPEIQFLGRSLPVTTALVPFASAVAGTMAGVRKRPRYRIGGKLEGQVDPGAVKRGFVGGSLGAGGGIALGNLLETERQRRNQAANEAAAQKDELGF